MLYSIEMGILLLIYKGKTKINCKRSLVNKYQNNSSTENVQFLISLSVRVDLGGDRGHMKHSCCTFCPWVH